MTILRLMPDYLWASEQEMHISVVQLAQAKWVGRVWLADKMQFTIFIDEEGRAFDTCAEYMLQRGYWKISGRLPFPMHDQLFYPSLGDAEVLIACLVHQLC